jgi:NhaP-type Na+/H+ or K+/H+ antiporter
METLIFLAMILLLGTLSSILVYKLEVSNVFFLLLIGIILNYLGLNKFSKDVVVTVTIIALVMIVFSGSLKFRLKDLGSFSSQAVKLTTIFFIINLFVLSVVTFLLFKLKLYVLSLIFAVLMYGIDPAITISMLGSIKNKLIKIIEIESIINTPLTIIVPLSLLGILGSPLLTNYVNISRQFLLFIVQFMVALGLGLIFGVLVTTAIDKLKLGDLSYIVLITSAIVVYILSELLKGSGVLTVTVFGVYFGNYHLRKQMQLEKFTVIFSDILKIIVFILIGTMIVIQNNISFILKGLLLFIIHLVIRFFSVVVSFKKINIKEKLFIGLNVPKGVDVAVVSLMIIASYSHIRDIKIILNLGFLFILYSIVLSTIITRFSNYFLTKNVTKK